MKKPITFLLAALLLAAGCSDVPEGGDSPDAPVGAVAEVNVSGIDGPQPITHGDDELPQRPPSLVAQLPPEHPWPCEGDGQDGRRVQMIYAHGGQSNLATMRTTIEAWTRQVEGIFLASARETGGDRLLRFVTGPDCSLSVAEVQLSTNGLGSLDAMVSELREQGHARSDRIYHAFVESTAYCGIGWVYEDDRPGPENHNNRNAMYSRTDRPCWSANVAAHEIVHNLGGVQNSAPNSTKGLHTRDEHDVMSYPDGAPLGQMVTVCPDPAGEDRLDCQKDDYYSTAATGYLTTHWNTADAAALSRSAGTTTTTTTPPAPTTTTSTTLPPTTTTTVGQGATRIDLVAPTRFTRNEFFTVTANVSGACRPTGVVAFVVGRQEVSRQPLVARTETSGTASATIKITSSVNRPTIRANYEGSAACAPSTKTARPRATT